MMSSVELRTLRMASPTSSAFWSFANATNTNPEEAMARGPRIKMIRRASVREGKRRVRNWICVICVSATDCTRGNHADGACAVVSSHWKVPRREPEGKTTRRSEPCSSWMAEC
jgi:hypothetical protein